MASNAPWTEATLDWTRGAPFRDRTVSVFVTAPQSPRGYIPCTPHVLLGLHDCANTYFTADEAEALARRLLVVAAELLAKETP